MCPAGPADDKAHEDDADATPDANGNYSFIVFV
jgi:hypothetical protein